MSDVIRASEEGAPEGVALFIPPLNEVIWSAIFFGILFFMFWKLVLPSMKKALGERSEGIEAKLEKAEADRAEAQALLEQYREQLAEARADAAQIRTDAQAERQSIVAEARAEAQQAAAAVNERAQAQLAAEAAQVRQTLSRDVGRLATELAEKIVGESLDGSRVGATVDRFIADLEASAEAISSAEDGNGSGSSLQGQETR
ncbi:MAG TPA: F0F1 ATP synthase subunit B [Jiangellaceae bacterium]